MTKKLKSSNKETFEANEADNWFKRNIKAIEEKEQEKSYSPLQDLIKWLLPFKEEINNILEIGSGQVQS